MSGYLNPEGPSGSNGGSLVRGALPPADEPAQGMDAGQLLRALRRRWWWVVASVVIVTGIAWYVVPEDVVVYRATASLVLNDTRGQLPAGVVGGPAANVQSPEFLTSQVQVLLSRTVLGDVVDTLGLQLSPSSELSPRLLKSVSVDSVNEPITLHLRFTSNEYTVALTDDVEARRVRAAYGDTVSIAAVSFVITEAPGVSQATLQVLPRDAVITRVRQRLRAAPRERAAIIDMAYTDPNPERAIEVVNGVAEAYRDFNLRAVREGARRHREFIERQLAQAEVRLAQAREALNAFRESSPYYSSQERLRVEQAELLSLDTQREQLQADRQAYANFLQRVRQSNDEAIDAELRTLMSATSNSAGPLLSQLFTQLGQYQNERAQLLAGGAAATNPGVLRLNTLIDSARVAVVEAAQIQVRALAQRIAALEDRRARTMATLQTLPAPEAEESRLLQEVTLAEGTAQTLRAEQQRAVVYESMELGQVQVLDPAVGVVPEMSGNRARSLIFALILGVVLGGGGVLAREYSDPSIRRQGEAEAQLAAPGLGIIPPIVRDARQIAGGGSRSGASEYAPGDGTLATGSGKTPIGFRWPSLLALLPLRPAAAGSSPSPEPLNGGRSSTYSGYGAAADAYRKLRTNIAYLRPVEELRTLVVTSPSSDEGKTTTAANLALAFAREGRRVLLVDCDLRRPHLHKLFGVGNRVGFVDLVLERVPLDRAVAATTEERLFLLPRGDFDEVVVELLSSPRMKALVAALRSEFDLVIFDTSPMLLTADTAPIAAVADGVLVVVRAGRTPRAALAQAAHELEVVGAEVLGFVLNDPDAIAARYGEYYPDRYYEVEA